MAKDERRRPINFKAGMNDLGNAEPIFPTCLLRNRLHDFDFVMNPRTEHLLNECGELFSALQNEIIIRYDSDAQYRK